MKIPTDADGFVQSFDVGQADAIQNFFNTFGFVCIANVLNSEEIQATCSEFFSLFDKNSETSTNEFFKKQPFAKFGVIGNEPNFMHSCLQNRQNPNVYAAFSTVFGTKELIVDHDRFGALRPTLKNPEWKTIDRWLHLDCNPGTGAVAVESFRNGQALHDWSSTFLVQGFIALTDAREPDGGFHCVPGSHKYAHQWAADKIGSTLVADQNDPVRERIAKIFVRKGSVLIWNSFLLHANRPNCSENWRLVQYVRMYPVGKTPFGPLEPYIDAYPSEFKMTRLGRQLFGIELWDDDHEQQLLDQK